MYIRVLKASPWAIVPIRTTTDSVTREGAVQNYYLSTVARFGAERVCLPTPALKLLSVASLCFEGSVSVIENSDTCLWCKI